MAKLTDEDLISILRREEQTAQNWQDQELLQSRQDSFDFYERNVNNRAFGKEEGQSSVVTSEFADTVESVMPGLMRVFASGDEIAKFTPMEQQDEPAAKEATQYVPHVLMRENDGFRILYWFFKDVLMYRLATATVDVEEIEKTQRKPIEGLTEEQMAAAEEMAKEEGITDVEWEVEPTREKQPQKAVSYGKSAGADRCAGCPHFLGAACELVEGEIAPNGWCKLYEPITAMSPPPQPDTFAGAVKFTKKKKQIGRAHV